MARCIGRNLHFGCLTCGTEQTKFCWMYTDPYDQHMNTSFPNTCTNPECTDPHITYIPRNQSFAQVREAQRCAVYMLPDGDYMVPDSNDPNSDMSKTARQSGGVRYEFNSVHELREFQRKRGYMKEEEWMRTMDEGGYDISSPDFKQMRDAMYTTSRNQVIDYDDRSLREGRDMLREMFEDKRKQHEESVKRFRSLRVGRAEDGRRYERLRKR
jgi:hypothetical protein